MQDVLLLNNNEELERAAQGEFIKTKLAFEYIMIHIKFDQIHHINISCE